MDRGSGPICVFGASGFVGSHVAARLLQEGYSVRGTLRDASENNTEWLRRELEPLGSGPGALELVSASLEDPAVLRGVIEGCDGVISCAGTEKKDPSTIDLMVGGAEAILDGALEYGVAAVVFTSSTGSTNPPSGEPEIKNEIDHWSDPDFQIEQGKFSPAAKTLMDRAALARMEASEGRLRVSILNPSMIVGPAFQPQPVASLRAFEAIIRGERTGDAVPNTSMSMIDVRDLAELHVAALRLPTASGRYFGVKRSWPWVEILAALERVCEREGIAYRSPQTPDGFEPGRPTTFDLSRRRSLGVEVRDLEPMLEGVVRELKHRERI